MSDFRYVADALKGAAAHMDALKGATARMDALKAAGVEMHTSKALGSEMGALYAAKIEHAYSDVFKRLEAYSKTSDKIRALATASMPRAEIARHLGVRYQHVRNVLVRDEEKAREAEEVLHVGEGSPSGASGGLLRGRLGADGRVVIPASVREQLGFGEGTEVVFSLEGDEVRVASMETHLKRLQDKVRSLLPDDAQLVDELIAERKREAGAE